MKPETRQKWIQRGLLVITLCCHSLLHADRPMPEVEARLQQAIEAGDVLLAHGAVLRNGEVQACVRLSILLGVTTQGPPEGLGLFQPFSYQIVAEPVRLEVCDLG